MDLLIHTTPLPHTDPEASLAFSRDLLGFEVRTDVGSGSMRWITVGPPEQPATSILLAPPAVDPGITDDERRTVAAMIQEPLEQPYWIRDCAFRDPAGNLIRIRELR